MKHGIAWGVIVLSLVLITLETITLPQNMSLTQPTQKCCMHLCSCSMSEKGCSCMLNQSSHLNQTGCGTDTPSTMLVQWDHKSALPFTARTPFQLRHPTRIKSLPIFPISTILSPLERPPQHHT